MTFTITLGWWLLPLALTLVYFGGAKLLSDDQFSSRPTSSYGYADAIVGLLFYAAAVVLTLFTWLVYFISLVFTP